MKEIIKILKILCKVVISYIISTKVKLMYNENKYLKENKKLRRFKLAMLDKLKNEIEKLEAQYKVKQTKRLREKIWYNRKKWIKIRNNEIKIVDLSQGLLEIAVYLLVILTSSNIALQIKISNYHIYLLIAVGWITFVMMWFSIFFIKWISLIFIQQTKRFYVGAFYFHIGKGKAFFGILLLGIALLVYNNYTQELLKKNQSFLILESEAIKNIGELKNSTIEILNENNYLKWTVNKYGKIISDKNKIYGNYKIENLLIKENNTLTLYYDKNSKSEENSELKALKGEYVDLKDNNIKIFTKDNIYSGVIVSGKVVKLSNGTYLPLSSSYRYLKKGEMTEIFVINKEFKTKRTVNYIMTVIFVVFVLLLTLKNHYFGLEFITKEKIMYYLLQQEERYGFEIRKLVLSIMKIIRMATAIFIPTQVYLLRNVVFNIFLEKSLYSINKNVSLLFSLLFSETFLLTLLAAYGLRKTYKILRVITKIIYEERINDLTNLIEHRTDKKY